MESNIYLINFIKNTLKSFRLFNHEPINIVIDGIYYSEEHQIKVRELVEILANYNFFVSIKKRKNKTQEIKVCYSTGDGTTQEIFSLQLHGLLSLVKLSSHSQLTIPELLILRITGQVINRIKVIYKAIVLDLDDTVWMGTLSEIDKEGIRDNLHTQEGLKFISFMKFIRRLGEELGIFIAICSRNSLVKVQETIKFLKEEEFPLKNQIDVIAINENNKSGNISKIASELSILTSAIIFIDDNIIVRNEVRNKLPEVYVPEWHTHSDLFILLETSSVFERPYISKQSQERRKQYRIIKAEKKRCYLPSMICEKYIDENHIHSYELYGKSNQFNFSQINRGFDNDFKSLCFKIFTLDNDDLGICSTLTYQETGEELIIHNWAISCRFFEIGLEECILKFLNQVSHDKDLVIRYNNSDKNQRVKMLLNEYPELFFISEGNVYVNFPSQDFLDNKTNIIIRQ